MSDIPLQAKWREICEKLGKPEARKLLSKKLREAADFIDKDDYPDIFGADFEIDEWHKDGRFIEGIHVILSYPWPG